MQLHRGPPSRTPAANPGSFSCGPCKPVMAGLPGFVSQVGIKELHREGGFGPQNTTLAESPGVQADGWLYHYSPNCDLEPHWQRLIKVGSLGMWKALWVFSHWTYTLSIQQLFCGREAIFLDSVFPLAVISYLSACKSQRAGTCQGQMPIDGQELAYCTGEGVTSAPEISSGTWEVKRKGLEVFCRSQARQHVGSRCKHLL